MKNLNIIIFAFLCFGVQARETCQLKTEATEIKHMCSLKSRDGNLMAEVVFLEKGCSTYTGEEKKDCYLVRACDSKTGEIKYEPAPLFYGEDGLKTLCQGQNRDNRIILGHPRSRPQSPIMGTVECQNDRASKIVLSDQNSTDCLFLY